MRKSVAIGIAGVTAVVVAAWRQIQRDNALPADPAPAGGFDAPTGGNKSESSAKQTGAGALFTPSVSEKSTKAELYDVATEMGIDGRSKMNKTELLDAIRAAS